MNERIRRQLEKIEASMAPREVPKPRFTIRFIDPETHEVAGVVHLPRERDAENRKDKTMTNQIVRRLEKLEESMAPDDQPQIQIEVVFVNLDGSVAGTRTFRSGKANVENAPEPPRQVENFPLLPCCLQGFPRRI
jgi:hypothetical protein